MQMVDNAHILFKSNLIIYKQTVFVKMFLTYTEKKTQNAPGRKSVGGALQGVVYVKERK